ncbi:MAG TPA: hypothetical protein VHB51_01555 [Candidatus Saccharimonadales bacterium]|nr:hypothetical protein [Candidatus Saccharimonadales bacterium]
MHLGPRDDFENYARYIEDRSEAERLAIYDGICDQVRSPGYDGRFDRAAMVIELVWMDEYAPVRRLSNYVPPQRASDPATSSPTNLL